MAEATVRSTTEVGGRAAPTVVAPTPLPWQGDESLDHDALAANVERWARTALSGYVLGSTVGEEPYVSEAELLRSIETVAASRRAGQLILSGIDNGSPAETLRQADAMAGAGADFLRIRMPGGGGGARIDAIDYFRTVTSRSPVPVVILARIPRVGKSQITPQELADICSLPNVHAYIGSGDLRYEANVSSRLPGSTEFWASNASLLVSSAMMGAVGACCFFADWAPDLVGRVLTLVRDGRFVDAIELQESLLEADLIGMSHGVAAIKAGLAMLGHQESAPRLPRLPLEAGPTEQLRAEFRTLGLLS